MKKEISKMKTKMNKEILMKDEEILKMKKEISKMKTESSNKDKEILKMKKEISSMKAEMNKEISIKNEEISNMKEEISYLSYISEPLGFRIFIGKFIKTTKIIPTGNGNSDDLILIFDHILYILDDTIKFVKKEDIDENEFFSSKKEVIKKGFGTKEFAIKCLEILKN